MSLSKDGYEIPEEFYGQTSVIIGKRGSGKSYTARVIIEDGVKEGHTFTVIDPQGAYENLPDFDDVHAKDIKDARKFGILIASTNRNTRISTKGMLSKEENIFLDEFLKGYKKHIRKGMQTIVIDEIHKFAPEGTKTQAKESILGMFQENRSDGLGAIAVSQRPARMDKTIISQSDHMILGKVTSIQDKDAIKRSLDNEEDIATITKLQTGQFYLYGLDLEDAKVVDVREAETEHSGGSPKNILTEDAQTYNRYKSKVIKRGGINMVEEMNKKEIVKGIVPSAEGFMDLAKIGMKFSVGAAGAGLVGQAVSLVPDFVPVVSNRSFGAVGTTIGMYALYRNIDQPLLKDVLKYGAAGSAAYSVGSLAYDVVGLVGIEVPAIAAMAMTAATGATPTVAKKVDANAGVGPSGKTDLDTQFS